MMHNAFSTLILAHVVLGAVALCSFWIPAFAPKRRGLHTRAGQVFAWTMMATASLAGAASVLTLVAPLATHPEAAQTARSALNLRLGSGLMLGYLASITFVAAFSGLRAIRLRGNHAAHRSPSEIIANVVAFGLAVAVLVAGIRYEAMLLIGLSVIGLIGVPGNLRFIFATPKTPQDWLYQHISSMLGAGIAAHTAFLIFGTNRLAPQLASEPLVWLAPTLIGVPVTHWLIRKRRRQFAARRAAVAGAANPQLAA
ncbi:MAG: hypothetical protein AAGE01_15080 [Pseudomonadota bacterium]